MEDSTPDPSVASEARRTFLKKAGLAAGAAWVAPTLWSGPAAAQSGSGPTPIPLPIPPFGLPSGIGTFGGIAWQGGTLEPQPGVWQVTYIPNVPIELVALQLVNPHPATNVGPITPTPGPGTQVPGGAPIVIDGTGPTPQLPSFFDVFIAIGP